jgi:hypothetical protein
MVVRKMGEDLGERVCGFRPACQEDDCRAVTSCEGVCAMGKDGIFPVWSDYDVYYLACKRR